jgi:hypothetical protein
MRQRLVIRPTTVLGSGACEVADDSGAADAFIADWLSSHPRAVAVPISAETKAPWVRGTVMPQEVFIWVEDRQESLTLSLVQQGFYPAQAFQDMVARDQALRAAPRVLDFAVERRETAHELERQLPAMTGSAETGSMGRGAGCDRFGPLVVLTNSHLKAEAR